MKLLSIMLRVYKKMKKIILTTIISLICFSLSYASVLDTVAHSSWNVVERNKESVTYLHEDSGVRVYIASIPYVDLNLEKSESLIQELSFGQSCSAPNFTDGFGYTFDCPGGYKVMLHSENELSSSSFVVTDCNSEESCNEAKDLVRNYIFSNVKRKFD